MLATLAQIQVPMPPGGQIPFEVVLIVRNVMTALVFIALGIPIIRALSRRFVDRPAPAPVISGEVTQRLERIEQAVDSIAIEVERISEAQRFTTKLLTQPGGIASGLPAGSPQPPR